MTVLRTARVVAAILATVMLVFLVVTGAIRADNPFMVPDLLLSILLLVTACLPARWAAPALLFAFGLASGVWTTSLSHYAVRGELVDGLDHLPLIGACVIQSLFLARRLLRGPVGTPRDLTPADEPAAG
jgi:ABC-type dipeptide/oligopeptide/nickel transport system permease component